MTDMSIFYKKNFYIYDNVIQGYFSSFKNSESLSNEKDQYLRKPI